MKKMKSRKIWILWIAIFLLASGLVSCQEAEPPPEPATIVFGIFPWERDHFEPLIEGFKEVHPEITIELEDLTITQNFNVSDYPNVDVFEVDLNFFFQNQIDEAMLDLSPLIEQDKSFDISDFYPGTVDLFSRGGQIWALPSGINPYVLYYNKDLFDSNGLDYPTGAWTWDDLLTAAMVIQDDSSDTYGFGVPEQVLILHAFILMSQHGGQLFDDLSNPTKLTYNHPLNVEALEWFGNLYHLHKVAPTIDQANDAFGFGDQALLRGVLQGKIGMWPGYFSERGGITWPTAWDNFSWGMAVLPGDVNTGTSGFGSGFGIASSSQSPLAAWEWVVYLTEQVPMLNMPARRSLAESREYEALMGNPEIASAARNSAENIALINPDMVAQFGSDLQYIDQVIEDIVSGDATAAEALDWAQSQVDGR